MEFKPLKKCYMDQAILLAQENYEIEQQQVAALYNKNYKEDITQAVTGIFENEMGYMALDGDVLIGYLAFPNSWKETDAIHGTYSPVCGYAIKAGVDRAKIISQLFQRSSEDLIKRGVGRYQITVYAHDSDVIESYVFNQFGILCTDAIKMIQTRFCDALDGSVQYKELTKNEIKKDAYQLIALWRELVKHLQSSPTYYLGAEFTDEVYLDHILNEDTRLFVAKDQDRIIGIVDCSKDGNHFATQDEETMNIGDLYVVKSYRGKQIAQSLLQYASDELKKSGCLRLWVEHGTTNPTALRFWDRYFSRYTVTLTRHIDERVVEMYRLSNQTEAN